MSNLVDAALLPFYPFYIPSLHCRAHLRVQDRLHAEVVDGLGLHEILHVELVASPFPEVGQLEVEPLCVFVSVDVESQLQVVLGIGSSYVTRGCDHPVVSRCGQRRSGGRGDGNLDQLADLVK